MKTLDEVIDALEICGHDESPKCPYFDTEHWCCCEDHMRSISQLKNDALHYLKAYKDDKDDLTALRAYWAEQHENNALTWDELRIMEGKPVWVEPCKEWMLITEIETEPHIWLLSLDGMDYDMSLHGWQAYRKELTE